MWIVSLDNFNFVNSQSALPRNCSLNLYNPWKCSLNVFNFVRSPLALPWNFSLTTLSIANWLFRPILISSLSIGNWLLRGIETSAFSTLCIHIWLLRHDHRLSSLLRSTCSTRLLWICLGPHLLACHFGMSPSCISPDSLIRPSPRKRLSSGTFSGFEAASSWALPDLPMRRSVHCILRVFKLCL